MYVIKGKAPGLNEGTVYIIEFFNGGERDSVPIRKEHFRYEGKSENPVPVLLRIKGNQGSFLFFAENKKMQVVLHKDSLKNSVVKGSAVNKDYQLYEQKIKSQNERLNVLSAWSRSKGKLDEKTHDSVNRELEAIDEDREAIVSDFIKKHPNTIVSAYAITRHFLSMPELTVLEAQYNSLLSLTRF